TGATGRVIEIGAFFPEAGQLADFAVLESADLPDRIAIAPFAKNADFAAALHISDALTERSTPVWAIGFSQEMTRSPPRTGSDGRHVFVSGGFLKSPKAYRASAVLAVAHGF